MNIQWSTLCGDALHANFVLIGTAKVAGATFRREREVRFGNCESPVPSVLCAEEEIRRELTDAIERRHRALQKAETWKAATK